MTRKLRPGDFWRICDRSGFRTPASKTTKEWNGLIVRDDLAEARHPQDFVRGIPDNMKVPDPRPEPVPVYVGPLITELTADASAGATQIDVLHTARFLAGDRIGIYLADGDLHRAIVFSVDSTTDLTLVSPLPGAASSGGKVINYTAVASADLE
jgi:hypothetical protein